MDTFTLDANFALMMTLPVIACVAGVMVVVIARYLFEIVGNVLGTN